MLLARSPLREYWRRTPGSAAKPDSSILDEEGVLIEQFQTRVNQGLCKKSHAIAPRFAGRYPCRPHL